MASWDSPPRHDAINAASPKETRHGVAGVSGGLRIGRERRIEVEAAAATVGLELAQLAAP